MEQYTYLTSQPFTLRTSSLYSWSTLGFDVKSGSTVSIPQTRYLNGYRNPEYKTQIANRWDATTPLTARSSTVTSLTEGSYSLSVSPGPGDSKRGWGSGVFAVVPESRDTTSTDFAVPQKVMDLAKTRFYNEVRDARKKFQSGEFLAELRETLHMLMRPAQSLRLLFEQSVTGQRKLRARYVKGLRLRGRKILKDREIHGVTRALSDSLLEYSFGWAPFVNSIYEGAEALASRQAVWHPTIAVRGRAKSESAPVFNTAWLQPCPLTGIWRLGRKEWWVRSVRLYGAVHCQPALPLALDVERFGLDLSSWLPTLWEVIPYSVFFDYFANIGDVINAWSTLETDIAWAGVSQRSVNVQTVRADFDWVRSLSAAKSQFGDGVKLQCSSSPHSFEYVSKRIVRQSFDRSMPSVHFKLPGTGLQWLNLGAFIHNSVDDRSWYDSRFIKAEDKRFVVGRKPILR